MKIAHYLLLCLCLLVLFLGLEGCRWASGPGDTVPAPPRALVEQSFKPGGVQAARPDAPASSNGTGSAATTK